MTSARTLPPGGAPTVSSRSGNRSPRLASQPSSSRPTATSATRSAPSTGKLSSPRCSSTSEANVVMVAMEDSDWRKSAPHFQKPQLSENLAMAGPDQGRRRPLRHLARCGRGGLDAAQPGRGRRDHRLPPPVPGRRRPRRRRQSAVDRRGRHRGSRADAAGRPGGWCRVGSPGRSVPVSRDAALPAVAARVDGYAGQWNRRNNLSISLLRLVTSAGRAVGCFRFPDVILIDNYSPSI